MFYPSWEVLPKVLPLSYKRPPPPQRGPEARRSDEGLAAFAMAGLYAMMLAVFGVLLVTHDN